MKHMKCLLALLLAAALFLAVQNKEEADQAAQDSAVILNALTHQLQNIEETSIDLSPVQELWQTPEMSVMEFDGNRYIGILEIPRLGLSLPVAENWSEEQLKVSPGRYSGSYYTNDLVICGHNYPHHFAPTKYLENGDEVYFITADGVRMGYTVLERETVWPTEIEKMIDRGDNMWDLTLFTCNNGGSSRCAVRCIRDESLD